MAARRPLTPRQRDVLDAIRTAITATGTAPSLREIGERVGLSSPTTVHYHVRALEAAGYIRRAHGVRGTSGGSPDALARTIELLDGTGRAAPVGRWCQAEAVLRIDVPAEPAPVCTTHPRTADNRWFVAGVELCRACGRAAVAGYLARTAGR